MSHQAKCSNFFFTSCPAPFLYLGRICAWWCTRPRVWIPAWARSSASQCVCTRPFYFLDWSVGALLFSKLVTYFKASNWHDGAPTALRVTRGFIKACIWNSRKMLSRSKQIGKKNGNTRLTEHYKVTDMCQGVSDHLSERSRMSKRRFDELQRTCRDLFASQWNIT